MNVNDVGSSYLMAKAEFEQWKSEFFQEWFQPQIDMIGLMFYRSLDEPLRQELRERSPEMRQLEARVKKLTGGKHGMVG